MKRNILLLLLLIISANVFSQINVMSKKIFLDSLNRETTPENYSYTRVITNYSQKSARYVVTDFYKNGRKKMTGSTLDRDILKKDGEFICYYKNGAKESVINYSEDHKSGKEINWYENQSKKSEKQNFWDSKTKKSQTLILNYWDENKNQTVIDGNGLKQGTWQGSDILSKITFIDNYDRGVLISGVSIDENNVKSSYSSLDKKQAGKK
jgi:antitoxin component YwqK of YwqJK toxin-antitoxin module